MQSRMLHCFLVISERKNITEAAKVLNVSQPALTKTMQRLEEDIGVKLFDRVAVGVRLTKFGEILLQHVKVMENEYRHAMSRIDELRGGRAQALRIGAGPVWLVEILPPVIARFHALHRDVRISLVGGVIDTLVPDLISGDLDLICVSLDFPNRSEIIKQPLFDIHHVLIADPSHPLANLPQVDAAQIQEFSWMVLMSDYVGNERISSFFSANGLKPPRIALETTSIHSLLQGLKGADLIAHIPAQMLGLAKANGLVQLNMRQTIWETTAGYAHRASARLSGPMKAFVSLLHAEEVRRKNGQDNP